MTDDAGRRAALRATLLALMRPGAESRRLADLDLHRYARRVAHRLRKIYAAMDRLLALTRDLPADYDDIRAAVADDLVTALLPPPPETTP